MTMIRFFLGKGGVGKTTSAAAYSVGKALQGKRVLVVSLDPAHNLGDVFEAELGDDPVKIMDNLVAIEVDYDKMIKKHLKELTEKIKDIYGYLKIFNLDRYVDVLKHSPGVEEQASLEKIIEIVKKYGTGKDAFDIIVFDTPPTGLTLRIMALPTISLIWIERLIKLRLAILERRQTISRITGETFEIEIAGKKFKVPITAKEDPIFKELVKLKDEYSWINERLTDPNTTAAIMVINPETLPVLEAYRAVEFLKRIKVPVTHLIVNKIFELEEIPDKLKSKIEEQERALALAKEKLPGLEMLKIPYLEREPRGLDMLKKVAEYLSSIP